MGFTKYKVLFVAYNSLVIESGYKTRVVSEIQEILKVNSDIKIFLICFDEFKTLRSYRTDYEIIQNEFKKIGVELICHGIPSFQSSKYIEIATAIYVSIITLIYSIRLRVQIIHAQSHGAGFRSIIAKFVTRKRLILDVHGANYAERVYGKKPNEYSRFDKVIQKLDNWIIQKSNGLIFVSEAMAGFYKVTNKSRYIVLPCCVNTIKFNYSEENRTLMRKKLGLSDRYIVTFNGSFFQKWQEPDDVVKIFKLIQIKIPNAFLLILSSDNSNKIYNFMLETEVLQSNFAIFNLKHDSVAEWLAISNLGLLIRRSNTVNSVASPTKFGEYLACGVPVLISENVGDYTKIVAEDKVGSIVRLYKGQISLDCDSNYLLQLDNVKTRIRCREIAMQRINWSNNINLLVNLYEDVVKK